MSAIIKEERIGGQRLILGDSREVLPLLPSPGAIVADPPYGIEGTWNGGNSHGWGKLSKQAAAWDKRPGWLSEWVSSAGCPSIVWGGQYFALPASGSWLVWDKLVRQFTSGHCELAWTNLGMPMRAFNYSHGALATEGKQHPTQKPLALMEWCLGFVPKAKTILDPFAGSGTTLVACQRLGRMGTGIEIDPEYFEIACRRVEEATRQPDLFVAPPEQAVQEELL